MSRNFTSRIIDAAADIALSLYNHRNLQSKHPLDTLTPSKDCYVTELTRVATDTSTLPYPVRMYLRSLLSFTLEMD